MSIRSVGCTPLAGLIISMLVLSPIVTAVGDDDPKLTPTSEPVRLALPPAVSLVKANKIFQDVYGNEVARCFAGRADVASQAHSDGHRHHEQ